MARDSPSQAQGQQLSNPVESDPFGRKMLTQRQTEVLQAVLQKASTSSPAHSPARKGAKSRVPVGTSMAADLRLFQKRQRKPLQGRATGAPPSAKRPTSAPATAAGRPLRRQPEPSVPPMTVQRRSPQRQAPASTTSLSDFEAVERAVQGSVLVDQLLATAPAKAQDKDVSVVGAFAPMAEPVISPTEAQKPPTGTSGSALPPQPAQRSGSSDAGLDKIKSNNSVNGRGREATSAGGDNSTTAAAAVDNDSGAVAAVGDNSASPPPLVSPTAERTARVKTVAARFDRNRSAEHVSHGTVATVAGGKGDGGRVAPVGAGAADLAARRQAQSWVMKAGTPVAARQKNRPPPATPVTPAGPAALPTVEGAGMQYQ
eukprot:COSAG05_NODE_91_length_19902_cov_59.347523_4_plen_372_part_00